MVQDAEGNEAIQSGKAAYYKVSGFCTFYPNDEAKPMFYLACTLCKKKVNDEHTGYRCEACQKTLQEANPTYNFGMKFSDHSETINV